MKDHAFHGEERRGEERTRKGKGTERKGHGKGTERAWKGHGKGMERKRKPIGTTITTKHSNRRVYQ